jgi:hypothetical protein
VVHVDKRVKRKPFLELINALSDLPNVRFSGRHGCEWGTWGIVAATQEASTIMLRSFPEVRHVFLASGSCLPLRPVEEMQAYLASRPRTDFIESVTTEDVGWTIGGFSMHMSAFSAALGSSGGCPPELFPIWAANGGALPVRPCRQFLKTPSVQRSTAISGAYGSLMNRISKHLFAKCRPMSKAAR